MNEGETGLYGIVGMIAFNRFPEGMYVYLRIHSFTLSVFSCASSANVADSANLLHFLSESHAAIH